MDCEFIECGRNIVIGQSAIVQSSVIVGNLFIIKKTIIEDNVVIGAHSVVMPGTHLGKNTILAGPSLTTVGQVLEEGWIYQGAPAKKIKKNVFFEDGLEDLIKKQGDLDTEDRWEELYTRRKDKVISTDEK